MGVENASEYTPDDRDDMWQNVRRYYPLGSNDFVLALSGDCTISEA